MSHIFVSYSKSDQEYALKLVEKAESLGFSMWIAVRNITGGTRWLPAIEDALYASSTVVVILTPESIASKWVEREIIWSDEEGKPMLGIRLRGEVNNLIFRSIQCYDVRERGLYDYLPPQEFFRDLKRIAPDAWSEILTPEKREGIQSQRAKNLVSSFISQTPFSEEIPQNLQKPSPSTLIDVIQWQNHDTNDFYSIAMLAISHEAWGEHNRAMFFFRKAQKLEPRVADNKWMTKHYRWTEQHHKFVEAIMSDPSFWSTSLKG